MSKKHSLTDQIVGNQNVRTRITTQSHEWFFSTYFPEYLKHQTAPFQKQFFRLSEDETKSLIVLTAFRGSGKSTIFTMSYPIWSILGRQQKKFVLVISQTQPQARLHLSNIKREFESNRLLRQDLGPFEEREEEWSSGSLVLPKYGARITALSIDQGIRGVRHGSHRPDLIICDDLDDIASVKTKESRDKTYRWFLGDAVPAGDQGTKIIIVGNLLHEDSLMMRLKHRIEAGDLDGEFLSFPLLEEDGTCLWPGKFKTQGDVATLKRTIGDEVAWQREMMLRIISDTERVVYPEWIQYYDELPKEDAATECYRIFSGVDVAISEKTSADYTAVVSVAVYTQSRERFVYVLPNPINERLTFPKTTDRLQLLFETVHESEWCNLIFIEDVGYQRALIQTLDFAGLPVKGISLGSADKRTRIALTTPHIQSGKVLFPKKGAEDLIAQLVGFGAERYDDLADAFSLVINKACSIREPGLRIIDLNSDSSPMITAGLWDMKF